MKGSQEDNKKKDKRNENGEHHEGIDGIVECIVYFERFSKKNERIDGIILAALAGGIIKISQYSTHYLICIITRFSRRE